VRAFALLAIAATLATGMSALAGEGLLLGPPGTPGTEEGPGRAGRAPEGPPLIIGEEESLWRLFRKGGLVMPAILVASIVGLAFAIERAVAMRGAVQSPRGLAEEFASRVSRGGEGAAAALVKGKEGVLARTLAAALARLSDGRSGMEEAAAAESFRAFYDLRRNVRPIGVVASVAPLLGLLGTVLGMIEAFDSVSGGGLGRGEELARGIAKALLTTGAGLFVAIPALVVYHYFRWRAEDIVRRAETEAASFIDRAAAGKDGAERRAASAQAAQDGGRKGLGQ
jgi:biopolymer transport protein ExbB